MTNNMMLKIDNHHHELSSVLLEDFAACNHRRRLRQATRNFASVPTENWGNRHVLPHYLSGAYFDFWRESAIIALTAFTKCSPVSRIDWLMAIISHFKMLDDGTILFLADYVRTYSLYARTMLYFYWSALTVPGKSNSKSAPVHAMLNTNNCNQIEQNSVGTFHECTVHTHTLQTL